MSSKQYLSSMTLESLKEWLKDNDEKTFRAKQIVDWLYKKRVVDPALMKNISPGLREKLSEAFICNSSRVIKKQEAEDGTAKLLIELHDGETIEAVVIPAWDGRRTFCISTQVGCPVKCRFCASGADGLIRNLKAAEIIEQVYHACSVIDSLPNNIVIMGMGEGLLNYSNLVDSLNLMCSPDYIGLGTRRITVSTSGIVKNIYRLADEGRQWNLALSLHAVSDEIRYKLIPENTTSPLADILDAVQYYHEKTGRMLTFEYVLVKGVNDDVKSASKLAKMAAQYHAKINLIPYNEVDLNDLERPDDTVINAFKSILDSTDVHVTMRIEKGSKISAACGQLRRGEAKSE